MHKHIGLLIVLLFVALISGCEKDEGRTNVSGTITLDGKPLNFGHIDFIPSNPPKGIEVVVGNATIVNGKYEIKGKLGLLPGEYKVKLTSERRIDKKTGKDVTDEDNKEAFGTYDIVDLIPPNYGAQSEVVFNLEKQSKTTLTFDLDMKTP